VTLGTRTGKARPSALRAFKLSRTVAVMTGRHIPS
jgi:hypothetical protein